MAQKVPKTGYLLNRKGEKIPLVLEGYFTRISRICAKLDSVIEDIRTQRRTKNYFKSRTMLFDDALDTLEEGRRKISEGISKLLQ